MKKTIIALMALAGAASAETTVLWDLDFTSTGVVINTADGITTTLANNSTRTDDISNGAITLNNEPLKLNQSAGNLSYSDEFTLVAVVQLGVQPPSGNPNQPNTWPAIFGLGESDTWAWKPSYYTATSTFHLDKNGFENWDGSVQHVDQTNKASGGITYTQPTVAGTYGDTITVALQNNGKGTLTLYVDGEVAGYTTITSANEYGSNKLIKVFNFGARNDGGNASNIILHDAQFVSGLTTQIIPEPTTATLSLLALAGLAARRRRR
ncbi:MAG: PEP-CTERM sorting domain-containing protein [Akkermansiaceae bacterium]|nr:PEP-CTERM sorting domain-containing protein [Akkermansiaceae bacterium]